MFQKLGQLGFRLAAFSIVTGSAEHGCEHVVPECSAILEAVVLHVQKCHVGHPNKVVPLASSFVNTQCGKQSETSGKVPCFQSLEK